MDSLRTAHIGDLRGWSRAPSGGTIERAAAVLNTAAAFVYYWRRSSVAEPSLGDLRQRRLLAAAARGEADRTETEKHHCPGRRLRNRGGVHVPTKFRGGAAR